MRGPRRGVATLLATGSLLATVVACDGGGAAEPEGDADRLGGLPGVRAASVTEEDLEEGERGTVVVVDVEADIDADELVAVLAEVEQLGSERFVVYHDWGTTAWPPPVHLDGRDLVEGSGRRAETADPATAATFLAAVAAHPDAAVTASGLDGVEVLLGEADAAAVAAAVEASLADPVLSRARGLSFRADTAVSGVSHRVRGSGPLTARTLARFRAMAASLDRLPDDVTAAVTVATDGPVQLGTDLVLPGVVTPERLTPQAYGDLLWPVVDAQIAVLAQLPRGSSYVVRNTYRETPGGRPWALDEVVGLTVGERPPADAHDRGWSRQAHARLERARRAGGD